MRLIWYAYRDKESKVYLSAATCPQEATEENITSVIQEVVALEEQELLLIAEFVFCICNQIYPLEAPSPLVKELIGRITEIINEGR